MNLNTQATFGRGRDTGRSSASSTGMIATGSMNTKGLFWGENAGATGVKVFGIENWWGNVWKSMQGYIIDTSGTQKVKMTYDKSDGSGVVGYNLDGANYVAISGATLRGTSGNYIKGYNYGKYGIVPYDASGTDSTYLCDVLWFNNNKQIGYAHVGGCTSNGLACGGFCVMFYYTSVDCSVGLGAALTFKGLSST